MSFLFILYFQRPGSDDTISNEFQFQEDTISEKYRVYKYGINKNIMCLGVNGSCDDAILYLIRLQGNADHDKICCFELNRERDNSLS